MCSGDSEPSWRICKIRPTWAMTFATSLNILNIIEPLKTIKKRNFMQFSLSIRLSFLTAGLLATACGTEHKKSRTPEEQAEFPIALLRSQNAHGIKSWTLIIKPVGNRLSASACKKIWSSMAKLATYIFKA